ncbi:MAG: glycine cleavage system protein H [Candidatus Hodarchaeota archaeon]
MGKESYLVTKTHQWWDPDTKRVGITDYAQDQLGEISFVDVEGIDGATLTQVKMDGDEPTSDPIDCVVESSKAVGDMYSPLSGTVIAIHAELMDEPEKLNEDPYGEGWLFALDPSNLDAEKGNLLSMADYEAWVASK